MIHRTWYGSRKLNVTAYWCISFRYCVARLPRIVEIVRRLQLWGGGWVVTAGRVALVVTFSHQPSPPEKKVADCDARAKNTKSLIILSNTLSFAH